MGQIIAGLAMMCFGLAMIFIGIVVLLFLFG